MTTPGPWEVHPDFPTLVVAGGMSLVARTDVKIMDEAIAPARERQNQPNARLIAAAPDLLEACAKAEAGISDWRLGSEHKDVGDYRHMTAAEPYLRSVLDALNSAIAKVEGR